MPSTPFRYYSPWLAYLTLVWLVVFLGCFPDPSSLFHRNWPLIVVGAVAALVGNSTAIGGGIVFIPVMMFVYQIDPVSSLKLALVTQSVGMTSGAVGWLQRREVPVHMLGWTIPALVVGAFISSFLIRPHPMLIKGLFGPTSLLVGLLTLLTLNRQGYSSGLPRGARWPVFGVSLIGGMITGWVAIGEGEIVAAYCMLVYRLSASKAVALGVVLLSINSIVLALLYTLFIGGIPWDLAVFTILGVLWGGRLGPYLTQRIDPRRIKWIFAWVAILDGLIVFGQFLHQAAAEGSYRHHVPLPAEAEPWPKLAIVRSARCGRLRGRTGLGADAGFAHPTTPAPDSPLG